MAYEDSDEIHIEDNEARGAQTTGHVRYILGVGLLLAVILMSAIWIVPAVWG